MFMAFCPHSSTRPGRKEGGGHFASKEPGTSHEHLSLPSSESNVSGFVIRNLRNLYAGQEATVRTGHGTIGLVPLENPMDRGAWWGAVYGVAKSRV